MKKNLTRAIVAAIASLGLIGPALASGIWINTLPPATGAGAAPATVQTTGGVAIQPSGCIAQDTGFTQGLNPATECVSPSQLANYPAVRFSYGSSAGAVPTLTNTGTDTTPVAGSIYAALLNIPTSFVITNAACLNGSAAGTDTLIYGIYNSSGILVASTSLSGVTASGTNAFQQIALIAPYTAAPGQYFIAYQASGTTTRFHTIPANGAGDLVSSQTGVTGTMATLSPVPSTFTAGVGPVCYAN